MHPARLLMSPAPLISQVKRPAPVEPEMRQPQPAASRPLVGVNFQASLSSSLLTPLGERRSLGNFCSGAPRFLTTSAISFSTRNVQFKGIEIPSESDKY